MHSQYHLAVADGSPPPGDLNLREAAHPLPRDGTDCALIAELLSTLLFSGTEGAAADSERASRPRSQSLCAANHRQLVEFRYGPLAESVATFGRNRPNPLGNAF